MKQFCKQPNINCSTLPIHTPTRRLTLDTVLERMIELLQPLQAHFLSRKPSPHI